MGVGSGNIWLLFLGGGGGISGEYLVFVFAFCFGWGGGGVDWVEGMGGWGNVCLLCLWLFEKGDVEDGTKGLMGERR